MVLDNCVFSAILYGVECWSDISCIKKKLQDIEMKALKTIMKVKKGTTNDLILHELRRPCVMAKIKDRQYSFFQKLMSFSPEEAIITSIIKKCENSEFIEYYQTLSNHNCKNDISERERRINNPDSSMCKYYCDMNLQESCCIYNSFLNDPIDSSSLGGGFQS